MTPTQLRRKVSYTAMKDGTKEDYELVFSTWDQDNDGAADWCLRLFDAQESATGVERVTRRQRSLQAGARALRDAAADDELFAVALLHDVGEVQPSTTTAKSAPPSCVRSCPTRAIGWLSTMAASRSTTTPTIWAGTATSAMSSETTPLRSNGALLREVRPELLRPRL